MDYPRNHTWNTFTFWSQGRITPETARGTLSLFVGRGVQTQKQSITASIKGLFFSFNHARNQAFNISNILRITIELQKIMNGFIGRLFSCSQNEESIWKWLQLANESNSFYWILCQDEKWEYSEFER